MGEKWTQKSKRDASYSFTQRAHEMHYYTNIHYNNNDWQILINEA